MLVAFFAMSDPLTDGFYSLSANINKAQVPTEETSEGVVSNLLPELELTMDDDDLLDLDKRWKEEWEPFAGQLAQSQNDNEAYWLGKQYQEELAPNGHPLVDNLIFEALETFLPIATRPSADPVVQGENKELNKKVRSSLTYWAQDNAYNLDLKQVARYWALYKLGAAKMSWSFAKNGVVLVPIRPQKLILDPDATIKNAEYTGEFIGEYRKETAEALVKRFPKKKKEIMELCQGKMGTKMQFIEWWTDEYMFWAMDNMILGKIKNPHWNYEQTQTQTDEMGQQMQAPQPAYNHLPFPKKPFFFLSVMNLGLHPVDDTSLISQNLPLQDLINKRLRQIDKNADNANGSIAVSGDAFTKEQAAGVSKAAQKGGTFFVPNGNVNNAIARLAATPLPNFVYDSMQDYRNELRNIFGTRGSTPQGTMKEQTVRGKTIIKGQDADRIGGGISPYLEQFSTVVFNYYVQMGCVYFNEPQTAIVQDQNNQEEHIDLSKQDFTSKLHVTVKDGSMIPKDPVNERNEAVDLWGEGALDPITFFEKLDFPNPRKSALQLYLWKADPMLLFPEAAQMMQPKAPPERPPSESINFKDLPPEGKVQLAQKAGIKLNPQALQTEAILEKHLKVAPTLQAQQQPNVPA